MQNKSILFALSALFLGACASTEIQRDGTAPVKWVRMENVQAKCGLGARGCYEIKNGVCVIYTPYQKSGYDGALHATLGHEVRHCFDGDFHPARTYMNMNRLGKHD